jgi:hypothetical protein
VTIIIQRYGTYDNPNAVTEKKIDCKSARNLGKAGYEFILADGSTIREPGGDGCDVAMLMPDGTLRAV